MSILRVTAKMIAQELGVSTATVDRVLNNRKGVSEKTIQRVRAKAEEMGYVPNTAAKYLATKKNTDVAFIIPVVPEYFWDEMEEEIKRSAALYENVGLRANIYRVDGLQQIDCIRKFIDEQTYDAIVVSSLDSTPYTEIMNEGIKAGIPMFTLNNDVPESNRISFVGGDYFQAGYLAAELIYLFSKKLDQVVLIREENDFYQMRNKDSGFRKYFEDHQLDVKVHMIPINSNDIAFYDQWDNDLLRSTDGIYVASGILGEVAEHLYHQRYFNPILVGHDMSEQIYRYLDKNIITATICQDPASQALVTVQQVYEYLLESNRQLNKENIIKLEVVTKSNSKYYINFDERKK